MDADPVTIALGCALEGRMFPPATKREIKPLIIKLRKLDRDLPVLVEDVEAVFEEFEKKHSRRFKNAKILRRIKKLCGTRIQ